jgi:hypothetical protein
LRPRTREPCWRRERSATTPPSPTSPASPRGLAGDPTEGAMVVAAEKVGLKAQELRRGHARVDVVPFE